MAEYCPTCGQALPPDIPITTSAQLVAAMREPPPPSLVNARGRGNKRAHFLRDQTRDVFEGYHRGKIPTGRFYVTYSGDEVTRAAVEEALRQGLIRLKYDHDGYWCLSDA